jgi:peptidoglycan/xylan/chitin deacetylase (PgdA/CDA1 family)
VTILRYHSVQPDLESCANSIGRGIIHEEQVFAEQMEILARDYHPVSMDEVVDFVIGRRPTPPRAVVVTFDDGYADNYDVAMPILNHYGIPAAIYVTVDSIGTGRAPWFCRVRHAFAVTRIRRWHDPDKGRSWNLDDLVERHEAFLSACEICARRAGVIQEEALATLEKDLEVETLAPVRDLMLSWEQIRKLKAAGHTIGSHTLTHPNLAQVNVAAASRELRESKMRLELTLGSPVVHFSYPSPILEPHWNEQTVTLTKEAGYSSAVTCTPGLVRQGDESLRLKRTSVPDTKDEFIWSLECTLLGRRL